MTASSPLTRPPGWCSGEKSLKRMSQFETKKKENYKENKTQEKNKVKQQKEKYKRDREKE